MMLRMENVNYVLDRFVESLEAGSTIDEVIEEFAFKHLQRGTQHRNLRNSISSLHLNKTDKDTFL